MRDELERGVLGGQNRGGSYVEGGGRRGVAGAVGVTNQSTMTNDLISGQLSTNGVTCHVVFT